MRIGMILDRPFPPDDRVEKEARSLISAGHKVYLLCFKHNNEPIFEEYNDIKVQRVFMPEWIFKKLSALILSLPFYRWFWKRHIRKFVHRNEIEVLHIHDLPLVGTGLEITNEFTIPLVADMHENYPVFISEIKFANTFLGKLLISSEKWFHKEKEWLNRVDRIIVVVEGMQERLQSALNKNNIFTVVPNSPLVKNVHSSQKELPEVYPKYKNGFNILYFGGLDSRRGLDSLIEAGELLKKDVPKFKIIIVGDGSYKADLLKKINHLQLDEYVVFEGWQPTGHLKSYLKVTDVCVIPHLKSPQTDNSSPNKLYLYMIFGKPIISTNCRSIQKIIEHEQCGLIYKSGNSKALAKQIKYIQQNSEEAKQMGQMGAAAVEQKYDWNITVQGLIKMYDGLEKN